MSFNTKDKLHQCLSCLSPDGYEVIVVDNASSDGSVDMVSGEFPWVQLIRNDQNLGFGAANNVGLDRATGQLVLFLNSDAYVQPGSLETLVAAFADGTVVAAGPKLLNLDGSLQESVAAKLTLWNVFLEQTFLDFFARRMGRGYWRTQSLPADVVSTVDQVMGACMMVRASADERFDERFFLYCEDTELCLRLSGHGRIVYVPQASVVHELGSSSVDSRWKSVARYNLGKELYFRIHRGAFAAGICWGLNRFGAVLRILAGVVRPEKAKIFAKVLFAKSSDVIPAQYMRR